MSIEQIKKAGEVTLSAKGIRLLQAHDKAVAMFETDNATKTLSRPLV
jgi:hypothetical protein